MKNEIKIDFFERLVDNQINNKMNRIQIKPKIILGTIIVLAVILGGLFYYLKGQKTPTKNAEIIPEKSSNSEDIKADLNGDGEQETLSLTMSGNEEENYSALFIAYDKNGKEIGRLPEGMPINNPMSGSAKVYTPIKENKNQFVSYDFVVGPHSSGTMFFGLFTYKSGEKTVLPICLTTDVNGPEDCFFWSGQQGESFPYDFDDDGVLEYAEIVDEYPKDGAITADIEKTVKEQFASSGQDAVNGMTRILKREQGGRGNRVIWGIYRYNGKYFEQQLGANYEKYYKLIDNHLRRFNPDYPKIMRKNEMSKSSLDYNNFVKTFWTKM